MKKVLIFILLAVLTIFAFSYYNAILVDDAFAELETKSLSLLKEGDIIFQTSKSEQSEAVSIATKSKFSHCGILYISDGKKYVFEAVQPVKLTPLEQWISQGKERSFLVKRLKNAKTVLTDATLLKMKQKGQNYLNKNYDLYFEWSDEKIYCSELVWKIYKQGADIELCSFQNLKDFNLDNPTVQGIMKKRYRDKIPYNENVIAPSQIANSDVLETVIDTYKF